MLKFKLAMSLLLGTAAFAQLPSNLDCKCKATSADKYTCECTTAASKPVPTAATVQRGRALLPGLAAVPLPAPKTGLAITPAETPAAEPAPRTATAKAAEAPKPGATPTGETTATGQPIYTGPKGGQYHYSDSGKKVYTRKKE